MTLPTDDAQSDDANDPFPQFFDRPRLTPKQERYWASVPTNEQIDKEHEKNPPRRGAAKHYDRDGLVDIRLCQTEVVLRLGRHLTESPLLDGNVYVFVGAAELNRRGDDVDTFPVKRHLSRWGFTKDRGRAGVTPTWIGFYTNRRTKRKLLVNFDKHDGHVMAFFATGERLIVHCTAGNIGNTRSPAEHHDLHRAMGRSIGWPRAKPGDVFAVCTPRSERFRKLTAERREVEGVTRAGLRFLHVDRGGGLIGLGEPSD